MLKRLMAVMLMALLIAAVASVGSVAEADEPDYTEPGAEETDSEGYWASTLDEAQLS